MVSRIMNILKHPIYKAIYDLCREIETLPASELATKLVVMASNLQKPADLLYSQCQNSEAVRLAALEAVRDPELATSEAACKAHRILANNNPDGLFVGGVTNSANVQGER